MPKVNRDSHNQKIKKKDRKKEKEEEFNIMRMEECPTLSQKQRKPRIASVNNLLTAINLFPSRIQQTWCRGSFNNIEYDD